MWDAEHEKAMRKYYTQKKNAIDNFACGIVWSKISKMYQESKGITQIIES